MPPVPAPFALLDLVQGAMVTQAVCAAAQLGIADTLGGGPLPAEEIAMQVGADPDATYRLLRLLASRSVFAERDDGRFELTPMAEALRSGDPMSMRRIALLMAHPIHWEDWGHFLESVQTGQPILPKYRGMSAWEYFGANPDYAGVFFAGMGNLSDLETEPVAAAGDYARFSKIVDVGGGNGALLSAILARATGAKGVLFAPSSAEAAQQVLEQAGTADRCTIETGSFLETVPSGGDVYILKHIVHDWPDARALDILANVRKAISPKGTLQIVEFVLPEGNAPHPGKLVDMWLMLLVGGKERTGAQYSQLLARAGFRLTRIVPTESAISIVEAQPD